MIRLHVVGLRIDQPSVRLGRFAVIFGFLFLAFPGLASGQTFPAAGLDLFSTEAAFKITLLDGTEITIENLLDPATAVGRSDPFTEGTEPVGGAPIFNGGAPPYPNTSALAPDPRRLPLNWAESDPNRREVHTEILSMNLTGGGAAVLAGQPAFNALNGLGLAHVYHDSFGEVTSRDPTGNVANDFPADSFFNIFAVVQAGGQTFANLHPLVVRREDPLTAFPPTFGLPTETYIHDPNFPAVLLYSTSNGLPVAYLSSAGHGSPTIPTVPNATIAYMPGISFGVDNQSVGLIPAQSPNNHVRDDVGIPEQQVTVYNGALPFNNQRSASLTGVVGAATNNFQPGDTINSMSSGRDGTRSVFGRPQNGVLHFSVDRNSQGAAGTDVDLDATAFVPKQAAGIYISGVGNFGSYFDKNISSTPMNDNFLVVDPTMIGLRPSLFDVGQGNVTSLELSTFGSNDLFYGTFTGPSFSNFDQATIFVYDPINVPFEFGNLGLFSTPFDVGLDFEDVIDALVLSDVAVIGELNADLDEVLFSLAPGSPALAGLDGIFGTTDDLSAADVFYSDFDGTFGLFASHAKLGLLFDDNIDALDIRGVPEPGATLLCAVAFLLAGLRHRRTN